MLGQGIYTALVTPFQRDEQKLDVESFHRLLSMQKQANIEGIVVGGTTGESSALLKEELLLLLQESASYSIPIIANIGTANTSYSVELAKVASLPHVKALLVVTPYYNKPTQEGIIKHIEAIVNQTELPIILYNVFSRTASAISPETVSLLYERYPHRILGIKEATQDMLCFTRLRSLCGKDFLIFCGDDAVLLPSLSVGSSGAISVLSNVLPRTIKKLFSLFLQGVYEEAFLLHVKLQEYINLLFVESNPIPVKYALYYMGYIENILRLPLTPLSIHYRKALEECVDSFSDTL